MAFLYLSDINPLKERAPISENSGMDALLNPQTGGYVVNQSAQSIENELYIRLVTPLGSYWADRTLGSRLHELRRQKHLKRIEVLAKQYAEQALQPVLQFKRAQSIQVTTSTPQRGWLKLHIEAVDAAGDTVTLSHKVAVI